MDDREKRFVDELVEASLRRCAGAEARPGLEGRVLAGVGARQQAERRRKSLFWIVGMATAAAVVAMLVTGWTDRQTAPVPITAKAPSIVSSPTVARVVPPVQRTIVRRPANHAASSRVDPRPQQFPTPRPLSEQEKLLVEYAQLIKNSPGMVAPAADQNPVRDLEIPPLSIAAIKIEPLPSLGNADEK